MFGEEITDGYFEDCYANGDIRKRGILKDGERFGYWEFYYENGNIKDKDMILEQIFFYGSKKNTGWGLKFEFRAVSRI